MSVLLLFLDGVGLGDSDPAHNPFVRVQTPAFVGLLGGPLVRNGRSPSNHRDLDALLIATDATLGIPGLPQSATGQTALLTGLNAPAMAGRHVTAYPTTFLRGLLADHSLFKRLNDAGRSVALANAYTEEYHRAVAGGQLRHAAFTFAARSAGVRLRTVEDLRRGHAIFHDLTNERPIAWGYDLPALTPQEAGHRLAALASTHDFTAFEFFMSDLSAHGRVSESPDSVVETIDDLLEGVLERLDRRTTLVLTSDHGNLEDSRTNVHTLNPVPTLVVGPARDNFRSVRAITDIAPAILRSLGCPA